MTEEPCLNCGEPVSPYDAHTRNDHTEWTCEAFEPARANGSGDHG